MVNAPSLHTARARAARSANDHQDTSSPISFQVAATDQDDAEQNRLDGSDFASVHARTHPAPATRPRQQWPESPWTASPPRPATTLIERTSAPPKPSSTPPVATSDYDSTRSAHVAEGAVLRYSSKTHP